MKVISLLLVLLSISGCSTIKGWFGKDKTGPQPTPLVEFHATKKFVERWHSKVGDSGGHALQPALTADAVYGVSAKGEITRLDRKTGREVWHVNSKMPVSAGVGVGDGLVLVGSDKGEVEAFGEDGKLRWKQFVSSEVLSIPQVADGLVVVRTGDGRITALNETDGKQRWSYDHTLPSLIVRSHAGVTVHRGVAYVGFAGGKLVAIRLADGSEVWENTVSQPRGNTELERISDITSNPMVSDNQVCAIAFQGRMACYDADQGSPLWTREIASNKGLFVLRKNIYLTDSQGMVMALDKDSGSTVWKNVDLLLRDVSMPFAQNDVVVVGDYEGYLHGLSRADGHLVARIRLDGNTSDVMPVEMDNGMLLQTQSGIIYSLSVQ